MDDDAQSQDILLLNVWRDFFPIGGGNKKYIEVPFYVGWGCFWSIVGLRHPRNNISVAHTHRVVLGSVWAKLIRMQFVKSLYSV